ncbi:MATE family efflux transporter, partial [Streptococcus hyovaginalis]
MAGIVIKIKSISMSLFLGLVQGSQPIFGFNYAAKNFPRVRKTLRGFFKSGSIISLVACLIFELFPCQLLSLFGSGVSGLYLQFGKFYMRTFLFFSLTNDIWISVSTIFTPFG